MKRKYKPFVIFLLFILFLSGCGNRTDSEQSEDDDSINIMTTIKGGRTGGAWAVFTEGIAESIRRENPGSYITVEPGSIIENPLTVGKGRVPYGLSYAMTSYAAYSGLDPYDQPYEDIRAVSVVIPANYYQFFIRGSLPYDSLDELLESKEPIRLSVNQQGSAGEVITREVFKQYGVTFDDVVSWGGSVEHLSGSMAYELMGDGRLDATGNAESAPSSIIIEASTTTRLKMLSLNEEVIEAVSENLGMESNTISAHTYNFQDEDVYTVSTPAILIVHKDVPDEEVYAVAESIYNSFKYLSTVHEEFKDLTAENIANVGAVPLHPGAEKFFKDAGVLE